MGYHYHGTAGRAVIEVCPVTGKKATAAAGNAGLAASAISTLLVRGDDKPGLGRNIAQALADEGINITFLAAQVIDKQFSAVIGFEDEAASERAVKLIKKAAKAKKK